ncbi:hypothetical protein JHN59_08535 [Streptomyces sp. MBT49]|uniref:DUF6415 family natural product biosynthesis protein n=1 Tax=unclassified Streptomyces TaxID=2593676 RepID=UPI00190D6BE2|nr:MULTISPECIES: DUF6415 family natural product biosynthesis protein [unclassified Streptomyces]MBK3624893.1 hypothetical protein [Streptomyces sp. MBT49]MBK3632537.1 hypothetical protein [Streptomyces sp. MBT97]
MLDQAPVDAMTIRQSVSVGLDAWTNGLSYEELVDLRELLRGHVQLLLGELHSLTPRMRGEARGLGVHCLTRAHQTLDEADDAGEVAVRYRVHDLAVTARSLLTLVQRPGPLGTPQGEGDISAGLGRQICGACTREIGAGEEFKRQPSDGSVDDAATGFVHTDSCAVLAAERRKRLQVAP